MSVPRSTFEILARSGKEPITGTLSTSVDKVRGVALKHNNSSTNERVLGLGSETSFIGFLTRNIIAYVSGASHIEDAVLRQYGLETPYYCDSGNLATVTVEDPERVYVEEDGGADVLLQPTGTGKIADDALPAIGDLLGFKSGQWHKAQAGEKAYFKIIAVPTPQVSGNLCFIAQRIQEYLVPA